MPARLACLCLTALLSVLGACSTTRVGDDVKSVNDAKTITASEWAMFADKMKNAMVETGILERYRGENGEPVVIAVGDFLNDTDNPDFTRQQAIMRNEITKTFVNANVAQVNMDFAGSGGSVDSVIQKIHELQGSAVYDQTTTTGLRSAKAPRLVLHGQFISTTVRAGRTTQYDYACAVKLIDVESRTTRFEEQILFPKQFTRGIFGG
jgi:PBP1b-binding outer membrane lipoprotein LpoB